MGTFDPATFLDSTIDAPNSTSSTPCPEGDFTAVAGEPIVRPWTSKKDGSSGLALDIVWEVDDARAREVTGRDKVQVKQGIMLDLTPSGTLDTGKGANVALGRLREAIGKNTPGQPFNFRMITGCVARIAVKHRQGDGDTIYADVKGVARV